MTQGLRKPDYGIDAPGIVRGMFLVGAGALVVGVAAALSPWPGRPWGGVLAAACGCAALYALGLAWFMVHSSRVGKLRARERLLDLIPWAGGEAVLDVGCGRGLMLVGAAKRLTGGRAVGIDLWRAEDQADNRPEAALDNARLEGVAGRVEVRTADMRLLPFADATFDVVVSHWAVHNLPEEADRATALREMVRVLKSDGRLVLADIQNHAEYAALLTACGMAEVREVEAGWRTAFGMVVSLGNFRPAAVFARKRAVESGSPGVA